MRTTSMILVFTVVLLFCLPLAWGEEGGIEIDAQARIDWIQKAMDDGAGASRFWQYGWTGIYGADVILEIAIAIDKDGEDEGDERFDSGVNATLSLLGVVGLALDPMTLHRDAKTLSTMPQASEEEIAAKLAAAELYLRKGAEREIRERSLKTHLTYGAVNLAGGLVVTLDGGRHQDGLALFAVATLVSELQIFTTPQRATASWEAYQNGDFVGTPESRPSITDNLRFGVAPGYVQVTCLF
ncbi:hypothetical protein DSLASN_22000 [Desulfoluna limicola]|uniref:Uncharacterized protein n=1 Tax=Desulfoluna limicola TaxID=2810562 RepID=A0ABM7PH80_9BACT|nr:hypothetical protein [Desulfoluna limicola]BCS96568.1 hypothetical protein DSLASN_22000 [Desulfoluna limicola]